MSETEHVKGKLIPVFKAASLEESAKALLEFGGVMINGSVSCLEQVRDSGYEDYFVGKDAIYMIEYADLDPNDGIAIAKRLDGGDIEFELKYYNGGVSFDEMMDIALARLDEKTLEEKYKWKLLS